MDFRTRRQLAVLAIVAIVVGGTGFFAFRTALPNPSCQDNRRNQGEEGVDCGGPCIPCALRESRPVEVFWVRFVRVRENTYDVAAQIRNPNVRLGAPSFAYEFKLLDTSGVNVASRRGTGFLYPGETAHLVEVGLVSGRVIERAVITIGEAAWVVTDAVKPDLIAGSSEYVLEDEVPSAASAVRTIIVNRGITDFRDVFASALAFDASGNLLGAHRTLIPELPAASSRDLRFVWPQEFATPPASLVVEARTPAALPSPSRP